MRVVSMIQFVCRVFLVAMSIGLQGENSDAMFAYEACF